MVEHKKHSSVSVRFQTMKSMWYHYLHNLILNVLVDSNITIVIQIVTSGLVLTLTISKDLQTRNPEAITRRTRQASSGFLCNYINFNITTISVGNMGFQTIKYLDIT